MTRVVRTIMQSAGVWVAIGAWVLATAMGVPAAQAQQDPGPPCTLATLTGAYIFDASGFVITLNGAAPKAVVEILNLNGDGTLTSIGTASVNGNVIAHQAHGTGTYSVNPDCTGTLAFTPQGPHFDIYVAPLGTQFHMIQVDSGQVLAGKVTRVSPGRPD